VGGVKLFVCLIVLTALAHGEPEKPVPGPAKTDVVRWNAFPGPDTAPAVTTGEAFVAVPLSSGTWDASQVSFVVATIVEAKPHALIVDSASRRFEVPGAFVAPKLVPVKLGVGAYVLFPRDPTLAVGRITKATKVGYTIAYRAGDAVEHAEGVAASHVLPLDGTLHFGAPVSCGSGLAWYVGPARPKPAAATLLSDVLVGGDDPEIWVLSDGALIRCRAVSPLRVAGFANGAHVLVRGRPYVTVGGGKSSGMVVPVERATVSSVGDEGLTYEVRVDEGYDWSLTRHVSAGDVFAR